MMKDEYVIISKTAILKKIEELEKIEGFIKDFYNKAQLDCLKQVLSQSLPLISEIEKAFDNGSNSPKIAGSYPTFKRLEEQQKDKKDYITNLKLDI